MTLEQNEDDSWSVKKDNGNTYANEVHIDPELAQIAKEELERYRQERRKYSNSNLKQPDEVQIPNKSNFESLLENSKTFINKHAIDIIFSSLIVRKILRMRRR